MSVELDLLRELMATMAGYRFVTAPDGTECVYRPDGSLALTAKPSIADAAPSVAPTSTHPRPPDAKQDPFDGSWLRDVPRPDGNIEQRRLCEDCWREMPAYVAAPRGFISPESDGKSKTISFSVNGGNGAFTGTQPLAKVVCLDCYFAAFHRVYPAADLPALPSDVLIRRPAPEPLVEETPSEMSNKGGMMGANIVGLS